MEQTENKTETKHSFKENFWKFHDRHYKTILLIPLAVLIFSIFYIFMFYSAHNDILLKDISLTGGTSATIYANLDSAKIKQDLGGKLNEIDTREIYNLLTKEKEAVIIETKTDGDSTKKILENYLGYELNEKNSSFESTGSTLSENFYRQLLRAIFFAFLFMAIIVFFLFRKIVPSLAVIISAFADIFMTLVVVDLLEIKISSAGIVAFLMLIGYSVDTDILLTTRILKSYDGSLNERIFSSFKTGITMTLTSLFAIVFALMIVKSFSSVLTQMFTILIIGLGFDIFNTWVTNVSLLKWYMKKNET